MMTRMMVIPITVSFMVVVTMVVVVDVWGSNLVAWMVSSVPDSREF